MSDQVIVVKGIKADSRKEFDKQVEKLMKLSKRLKVQEPKVHIGEVYEETFSTISHYVSCEDGQSTAIYKPVIVDVFDVSFELGQSLCFEGGWELKGIIGHTEGFIIPVDPDNDLPEEFDAKDTTCDHCNTKRRRNKSFLIQDTEGEWKRVGGACVKKFLGVNPESFFKIIQAYRDFQTSDLRNCDEHGNMYHRNLWNPELQAVDIDKIISMVGTQINLDGKYIKNEWKEEVAGVGYRGQEYTKMVRTNQGGSTSDGVKETFTMIESPLYNETDYSIDSKLVKEVYEYWNGIVVEGTTRTETRWNHETREDEEVEVTTFSGYEDFMNRTKEYGQKKRIRIMDVSQIIPSINSYFQYKAKLQEPVSEFVGTVGEKTNMELTITDVSGFEGAYGWSNIYRMVDANNNQITKFGKINERYLVSGKTIAVGSVLKFKAEVKKQEEFRGKKQTTIGRVSKFS
jgi:hypothetical protein